MMRILRIGCIGIGVLLASHAWADGCQLNDFGTLPVDMAGVRATSMVKINGNDTRFILDRALSSTSCPVPTRRRWD